MKKRKQVIQEYHRLQSCGLSKGVALQKVSLSSGDGCSTIRQWDRLFAQGGKRALIPKYQYQASRCRTPFSVIQIIVFLRRLLHWGGKRIAAELAARGLYQISHQGVYQIFRRFRLYTRTYHPRGKRDGIRYKRYEANKKNELWHLDFAGPFEDKRGQKYYVLVVLDDYSRYLIDLHLLPSLESAPVIQRLKELFKTSGKPKQIMTDNAPTFVSIWQEGDHQFQNFLKNSHIQHCSIQPYYPQSNGKAEAAVKITKNEAIKPFLKQKNKWAAEEFEELLHEFRWYYNAHRLHGGIGWITPLKRFDSKLKITTKGLQNLFFVRKIRLNFEFC